MPEVSQAWTAAIAIHDSMLSIASLLAQKTERQLDNWIEILGCLIQLLSA